MNSEDIILDEDLDGQENDQKSSPIASRWQRLGNYVIDLILSMVMVNIYSFVLMSYYGVWDDFSNAEKINENLLTNQILMGYLIPFLYFILMEHFTGRTIGKIITGTRVVDLDHRNPSLLKSFFRTVIRIVPFEAISIFSSSRLMWHDSWTNTFVVKTR